MEPSPRAMLPTFHFGLCAVAALTTAAARLQGDPERGSRHADLY